MITKRQMIYLLVFNLLYIVPFAIYYSVMGNYEFLIYIGVVVLIGVIIFKTLKRSHLNNFALWALSVWGLVHMLGGGLRINGETLYRYRIIELFNGGGDFFILKTDQVIHFYGFLVAAIVVYQLLAPHFKNAEKSGLAVFLAFIGSMGLGALNEVIEFIAFVVVAETGVGDIYNLGLDLIFNMAGALVGAFIARAMLRKKLDKKRKA